MSRKPILIHVSGRCARGSQARPDHGARALHLFGEGGVEVTKRKADYPQTEVELTPEILEPLENLTEEDIETGVVAGGFAPAEPGSEGMEPALFEDLLASVREAGAILRGEREAARRTSIEVAGEPGLKREQE